MGGGKRVEEMRLKPCPKCGKPVEAHGGFEEWIPTYYDPDSGGEPYYIKCECGMYFCAGTGDYAEFAEAWNRQVERIDQIREIKRNRPKGFDKLTEEYRLK